MANTVKRPVETEYAPYYDDYIKKVNAVDFFSALDEGLKSISQLVSSLTEEEANYRYEPSKWSIKELLIHLSDTERIFCYRALRFARNDSTELSGFDENEYVPESKAVMRSIADILEEYKAVRLASITLFQHFSDGMLDRKGKANGNIISVRALGYIIAGHEIHHVGVIKERYLGRK